MTIQSLYRILCDGPYCTASDVRDSITPPDGWRRLTSTEHLDPEQFPVNPPARSRKLSRSAVFAGSFSLMLCPLHHTVFDGHKPQTVGGTSTRSGNRIVNVSCSCGVRFPWTADVRIVAPRIEPSYNPERVWWQHLPAELRWYAIRDGDGA